MEVHAHSHSERKKFTHYLWEFLMLFLAVFCGFLAENQREHMLEHQREKQFMQSLINDLQLDTVYLNSSIKSVEQRSSFVDSTLNFFIANRNPRQIQLKTAKQMLGTRYNQVFFEHRSTIDQLNNSGGMRLIRNRKVVDSIEFYYQQIYRFSTWRDAYMNNQSTLDDFHKKMFNAYEMIKYSSEQTRSDSMTLHIDPSYLNQYLNHLLLIKNFTKYDTDFEYFLSDQANRLIHLIKNEYNLQ